jgi:hypothetical protein
MVLVTAVERFWGMAGKRRRQLVSSFEQNGRCLTQVLETDQQIEIASSANSWVCPGGSSKHNALEGDSRNAITLEGLQEFDQLESIGQAANAIPLVFITKTPFY